MVPIPVHPGYGCSPGYPPATEDEANNFLGTPNDIDNTIATHVAMSVRDDEPTPLAYTSLTQAAREFVAQTMGRVAGAGAFTGMNQPALTTSLTVSSTCLGALSAGVCGGMLLKQQIGTTSTTQKMLVSISTAAVVVAGGLIAGYASTATVGLIASGAVLTILASVPGTNASAAGANDAVTTDDDSTIIVSDSADSSDNTSAEDLSELSERTRLKLAAFTLGATPVAVSFIAVRSFWMHDDAALGARNLSVAIEALTIEIVKATIETAGVSVDRDALIFEEKISAMLLGLLPYVIASVAFNGIVGSLMQAELDSGKFEALILPALVGVLANCVKGAANAAALRYVGDTRATFTHAGKHTTRPHRGLSQPFTPALTPKVMLRYLMISCRDSVFIGMRKAGITPSIANGLSMAIYAGFAQFRELAFELMQGKGWSEPQLRGRRSVPV